MIFGRANFFYQALKPNVLISHDTQTERNFSEFVLDIGVVTAAAAAAAVIVIVIILKEPL